jgi:hypothetical protein
VACKRCWVCRYLQLLVGGPCYIYFNFACFRNTYRGGFFFVLSSFCVLCTQCCKLLWIVHLLLPFRYSLTFKLVLWAQISPLKEMKHPASTWLKFITEKCVHFRSCSYHIVLLLWLLLLLLLLILMLASVLFLLVLLLLKTLHK